MASEQPVVRSVSLPSRDHPCSVRIEALLKHLKSLQSSFSESHAIDVLQSSLAGLAELYTCLDELINSPSTNLQALIEPHVQASITLLDTCNNARDYILTITQHAHTLQSALRRKCHVEANVNAFLRLRRKAKKAIVAECLVGLKRLESDNARVAVSDTSTVVRVLVETSSVAVSVFRSLLNFLSGNPSNGWSLLSKLVRKRVSSSESLVARVDASLHALVGNAQSGDDVARARAVLTCRDMLETMNSRSESLVAELDRVFRCLLRNRVSLLNIMTR